MRNLIIFLQQVNVEQKLKEAPDSQYQIGVLIGSFVPFIVLAVIAYTLYYRAKKKEQNLK
ncbi:MULTISPECIES: hypothetical protein [Flavobacterium]|jgi:hypothetical protein|uniref:Uncharacterized protein n=1 Tax=Flavobacterium proteolyticum TaxID=2911683 RepID=A0ABR9WQ72_9FLAO|nr:MULTISPECIES: hypothetical protein [Flavobacterium]MBE9575992.1 hypothetical protein [Flavobacterium proteolyticum]